LATSIMANITTAVTFYIPPQFSFPFTVTQSRLQMHMIFENATASTLDVPWTAVQSVGPHRVRVVATNISVAYDTAISSRRCSSTPSTPSTTLCRRPAWRGRW
jgi:hypothetical protein